MPWLDKKYIEMIDYVRSKKEVDYVELAFRFKLPMTTARNRLINICRALERKYEAGKCIDTSQT